MTRMRPVGGGGGGASFCVRPADGSGPGVVLVANTPEAADEWTASLRAVLGTGSGARARGKGGLRGTVPSPVRRILVPA